MMRVRLSGEIDVAVDGRDVNLGSNKAQVVLVALALNAGSLVPVGRLIELVWGEDPPRTAEKTLQSYIARLRKACGPSSIERAGDAYRLVVDPDDVDLVRFDRLLDENRRADALAIWQGQPLAGLAASGLDPTVARLTERFLAASEQVLADAIGEGRSAEVIGQVRELAMANPLREGAWALLIRALWATGRQADALRAYNEAREHLVGGLGIEPGPELRALERQVLDQTLQEPNPSSTAEGSDRSERAFLFTGIADATAMWSRHGVHMASAVSEHDRIITETVHALGGTVFTNTGDGLLASFENVSSAVDAAVQSQLKLTDIRVGDDRLAVRMAIGSGQAEPRDDAWVGQAVSLAARLLDAAHGHQILVSDDSRHRVGSDLDGAIDFSDLGLLSLRGRSRPERVHQVVHPALPRRFAPLRTIVTHRSTGETVDFPPQLDFDHGVGFVGREDHQAKLLDLWQLVGSRCTPQLALLAGEPGVGKTRLAAEVARSIHRADGPVVVYGRCLQDHRSPFRPVTQALASYASGRPDAELRTELGPHAELLVPVMPGIADRFPDLVRQPLPAEVSQVHVLDAATSFLERVATSPLVMVLDDIQWADESTLALLLHLMRNAASGELFVVATYRDVEVDRNHPLARVLGELRRESNVERIAVRGIDRVESIAMAESVLGHELADDGRSLAERAGEGAGGNPFFLQEMLRHFMEAGILRREQGRWVVADAEAISDSVPDGIREVVGRRLDQVSEDCNVLLRVASVLNDSIDITLLVAVAGFDQNRVLDLLDEALEGALLVDGAVPDDYEFSHALIRQSLYDEFSTARRLRLHHRIATAIGDLDRTDEASVVAAAHHHLAAGPVTPPNSMSESVRAAARFATQRAAHAEAAHLLEQALDQVDGSMATDDHFALLGDLAASQLYQLDFQAASDTLETMVGLVGATSSTVLVDVVTATLRSVVTRTWSGRAPSILGDLLDRAAERTDLDRRQATALAVERFLLRRGDLLVEDLTAQLADMTDDEVERAAYAVAIAPSSLQSLARFRDQIATLPSATSGTAQAALVWLDAVIAMASWEPVTASPEDIDTLSTTTRTVFRIMTGAAIAMRRGDFDAARRAERALGRDYPPGFRAYRAHWERYEQDAVDDVDAQLEDAQVADDSYVRLIPHVRLGPPDQALISELAPATTSLSQVPTLIQAAWEAGLVDLADDFWDMLRPATGLAIPSIFLNYVAAVDYYLGLLAELRGDSDRAIELHLNVIATSRSLDFVMDAAYATVQLLRLLNRRGRPGDNAHARRLAVETLERLEPTELVRQKRLINEALAGLPSVDEHNPA